MFLLAGLGRLGLVLTSDSSTGLVWWGMYICIFVPRSRKRLIFNVIQAKDQVFRNFAHV